MDKERIKKGLAKAAPYLAGAALQVPFMFKDDNLGNLSVAAIYTAFSIWAYRRGVSRYDINEFVQSDVCQEYLGLYKEFVADIAKTFEELGIDPGVDAAVSYMFCLQNGYFSKDKENSYALFKDDKDNFIPLLGGRVTTGKQCCRHTASLFSDINNQMCKGLSPKISVYVNTNADKIGKIKPNHLVSGLVHKGRRLLFDSTCSFDNLYNSGFAVFKDDSREKKIEAKNLAGTKYIFAPCGFDNGFIGSDDYEQFMKLKPLESQEEIAAAFINAIINLDEHIKDFEDLHEIQKPKILRLSKLSSILSPHGEEIVK